MISIKTMKQVPTSRTIPSFRAMSSIMTISSQAIDRGRIAAGYSQMVNHETRRQIRHQSMSDR